MRAAWLIAAVAFLGLSGCEDFEGLVAAKRPVVTDAGCNAYAAARVQMPRPIGSGPLAEWVAATDSGMTGACK